MNWRGRPLTSHEVVVQTIAATRTSGGLRVEATLDPGDYPTGIAISKERFAALPLERHATHGAWNYTLHPRAASRGTQAAATGEAGGPACGRQEMLRKLDDERLTGMSTAQLEQLAAALAPAQAARAQQRYSQQRGGRARRARGNLRAKPLFGDAARLLLTLLYQRQVCSMNVLADLLEVTATCIGDLVGQTREILEDHGHHPGTAPVRFTTPQALLSFLDSGQRPARAAIIEQLSHPALTGLTRAELRKLTERLAAQQAAQAQRLSYQRRGGQRQPGTRGGVFPQKISNSERVLLTILHQRKLCTLDVLAEASATSADPPSATSSARPCRSSSKKATFPATRRPATAPPPTSSPQDQPAATRRQVNSSRLHYHRNLLTRVPKSAQPWVSTLVRTIFEQPDAASVRAQHAQVVTALEAKLPAAAAHLDEARDDILAFTAFPREVWRQIWSNNPQERLNKEVRRRTDVVGIFPGRDAIIRLVGAVLAEQNDEWTEARRYMGPEILAACRKPAGNEETNENGVTIEAIGA